MQDKLRNRVAGVAVGAAVGDALGMPLEFGPLRPANQLVREMLPGRIPAGSFTDDTEMALALAESLLTHRPLNPEDLAQRFVTWIESQPPDVGIHTASVLRRIAGGESWETAVAAVQAHNPGSAGNGSLMRCWPVALAYWDDLDRLVADSVLQSQVTHPHQECNAVSAFVNVIIFHLLHDLEPEAAIARALDDADIPEALRAVIKAAPGKNRHNLPNSGWIRHTLESAIWGLLTTNTFEDAVVNVVNLGNDADTAGAVVGPLAGAAYGLDAIPQRWRIALHGEFPLGSGRQWHVEDFVALAEALARG
ncbi:MAG: ADP-ribosylglycohydrolase family protein [Anaerolineae bacterium]|nr:ADP-ribosylglycohydrolase family protein [Anaerolineae bacterium]